MSAVLSSIVEACFDLEYLALAKDHLLYVGLGLLGAVGFLTAYGIFKGNLVFCIFDGLSAAMTQPRVANPPLSDAAINELIDKKPLWGFGYAFDSMQFMLKEKARHPEEYKGTQKLTKYLECYERTLAEIVGLDPESWKPYFRPDGSSVDILVLGFGFDKVLHSPLKPGVIERVKEALGTMEEPQWYVFEGENRFH